MVRFPPGNLTAPRRLSRLLLVPALMALAACAGGSEAADPPSATLATAPEATTTTEPSEVGEPELTVEEEVEAAYLEANRVFFSLMEDPTQPLDDLHATRTGEGLEYIRNIVMDRAESSETSVYPSGYPQAEILSLKVIGDEAVIISCETNDSVVRSADGEVMNDDVVTRAYQVQLQRESGLWRVANEHELERYEGRTSCTVE